MNIWVIDTPISEERRNWTDMLGGVPGDLNGGLDMTGWRALDGPGIVASHGEIPFKNQGQFRGFVSVIEEKKIWIIVVTGGGGEGEIPGTNIYCRKQKVKPGRGAVDEVFKLCFQAFKKDLERQLKELDEDKNKEVIPNYYLLEPAAAPEALLSLYLCEVGGVPLVGDQKQEMIDRAEFEFQSLVSLGKISENGENGVGSWKAIKTAINSDSVAGVGKILQALDSREKLPGTGA